MEYNLNPNTDLLSISESESFIIENYNDIPEIIKTNIYLENSSDSSNEYSTETDSENSSLSSSSSDNISDILFNTYIYNLVNNIQNNNSIQHDTSSQNKIYLNRYTILYLNKIVNTFNTIQKLFIEIVSPLIKLPYIEIKYESFSRYNPKKFITEIFKIKTTLEKMIFKLQDINQKIDLVNNDDDTTKKINKMINDLLNNNIYLVQPLSIDEYINTSITNNISGDDIEIDLISFINNSNNFIKNMKGGSSINDDLIKSNISNYEPKKINLNVQQENLFERFQEINKDVLIDIQKDINRINKFGLSVKLYNVKSELFNSNVKIIFTNDIDNRCLIISKDIFQTMISKLLSTNDIMRLYFLNLILESSYENREYIMTNIPTYISIDKLSLIRKFYNFDIIESILIKSNTTSKIYKYVRVINNDIDMIILSYMINKYYIDQL
jgi:aspartate/glutamate racemase